MNTAREQKIEEILTEALRLREEGISESSIFNTYTDFQAEIQAVFSSASVLESQSDHVAVPQTGLAHILNRLRTEKTESSIGQRPILSPFVHYWKIVTPIGLALVLVIGGVLTNHQGGGAVALNNPVTATSDSNLSQDLNGIDSQLAALNSDEANTNQALANSNN
ncbi:MAG: hypothetical protein JO026_00370 [Patescibacteria group bacterium]|nr:hypothetical protein [Patescibacteria group bacterium]